MACVSKYRRLHSTRPIVHHDYIPEPAAIVDHFAGSVARRQRFVFYDKHGWKHKTMSGWDADN